MSTTFSSDQIRRAMLELLHKEIQNDPMGIGIENHKMAKILSISQNEADFNIQYLKQKCLVRSNHESFNGYHAIITALGCDVVEHKSKFLGQFPFMEVTIQNQNIQGNAYGVVQASGNAQVTVNMQNAFRNAYAEINKANLEKGKKDLIQSNVKELEQELQKGKEADLNVIKKVWTKVKENADWLIPTLAQAVTEGVKIAFGIP